MAKVCTEPVLCDELSNIFASSAFSKNMYSKHVFAGSEPLSSTSNGFSTDSSVDFSVSIREVEYLYELFKKLSNCDVGDGLIHKEDFQLALFRNSKRENFFADRVFMLFDVKKVGVIEFGEFVRSLSIFHPDTSCEEKVYSAFKLYDLRGTGLIEREEVEKMLIALLSESEMDTSSEVVTAILDKTFSEIDLKQEGKIDKEEWKTFVSEHPSLLKIMTLPYLKALTTSFPSFVLSLDAEDNFSPGM